ncbi:MAG: hypothetical protein IJH64_14450 [Oscillospiraceae bacterium]|nr:hypothetical protein [Oscillospiraceae bacterium]
MSFLEKYMECEVVCKELIVENRAKSRNPVKYDDVEIVFGSVQAAVRNASMKIDENTLKRIFTANTKKGERSAKKLRDAIVHKMPNSELKEVNRRYKELMKDMKAFLRAVK